jgi:hypothetical protein
MSIRAIGVRIANPSLKDQILVLGKNITKDKNGI